MSAFGRQVGEPPRASSRWKSAAVVIALSLSAPVLSAAQTPPASETEATESAATHAELGSIVLVLPLESPNFGRAAEALKAGFLAAAAQADVEPVVIPHGDGDVLDAFEKAKDARAAVIVGPLVRDDVKTIANGGLALPPVIALNQLDESTMPPYMYALTLTLDSEARQLARRARDDGATTVAVIVSDSPLQKRFAAAFNDEWILAGGSAPATFKFDRNPEMLALLRRELARTPFDAALLAVDGTDAALAKSYVKSIPTYTGRQVNEQLPRAALRDLDDVRFVEIPWLVEPNGAPYAGLKHPSFPNPTFDRLYALGIDAFRVAQAFVGGPPRELVIDGATGHLALDANHQFTREGRVMRFRAGQIVPADVR
jgi:outer membrane PBP1 activator LpoA protein